MPAALCQEHRGSPCSAGPATLGEPTPNSSLTRMLSCPWPYFPIRSFGDSRSASRTLGKCHKLFVSRSCSRWNVKVFLVYFLNVLKFSKKFFQNCCYNQRKGHQCGFKSREEPQVGGRCRAGPPCDLSIHSAQALGSGWVVFPHSCFFPKPN